MAVRVRKRDTPNMPVAVLGALRRGFGRGEQAMRNRCVRGRAGTAFDLAEYASGTDDSLPPSLHCPLARERVRDVSPVQRLKLLPILYKRAALAS